MQNCISASPDQAPLVPNKRVAYAFGMVLGVADFVQEQAHFEWKSRLANHLTDGCGTLCGIQITQAPASGDVEIRLEPGYALSPRGHWLWVEKELCAKLGAWVTSHKDPAKDKAPTDFTSPVSVYVRLCYTECPTDAVPIAANACASAEDSSAPSRILETVSADFSWEKPDLTDQINIRAFAELLAQVAVEPPGGLDDTTAFLNAVRTVVTAAPPPGTVFHLPDGSIRDTLHTGLTIWATEVRPTLGKDSPECLPSEDGEDCLLVGRLDFTWNTTTGKIKAGKVDVVQAEAPVLLDNKVLQEWLAALQANTVKYTDAAQGDVTGPFFDLKVVGLQKHPVSATNPNDGQALVWDEAGAAWTPQTAAGDVTGAYTALTVEKIQGEPVAATAPTAEQALVWDGAAWTPQTAAGDVTGAYNALKVEKVQNIDVTADVPGDGQVLVGNGQKWILGDHGDIAGLGDDDHLQYLRTDGSRPLSGDWNVGNSSKITGLVPPTATGDAVRFDEAVLDGDPANDTANNVGDLGGTYPFPTVARLQGNPVSAAAPNIGDALVWNGDAWAPQVVAGQAPPVDITAILERLFRIPILHFADLSVRSVFTNDVPIPEIQMWFHFAPGTDNRWRLERPDDRGRPVRIFAEVPNGGAPPFLKELTDFFPQDQPIERNVWAIPLTVLDQIEATLFRFVFDLGAMSVRDETDAAAVPFPALKMMRPDQDRPIHWEGFDGKSTVTVFFERPVDKN